MFRRRICASAVLWAILWLPMRASAVKCSSQYGGTCGSFSKEEPCVFDCDAKAHCECCFEESQATKKKQEIMTTLEWWTNEEKIDRERHGWFRDRRPFAPIVGDDTMIAGVLYTHSQETLKMTVLFPPLYPIEGREAKVYLIGLESKGIVGEKTCNIEEGTWHCLVRFDSIPHSEAYIYEVQYAPNGDGTPFVYEGNVPIQTDYPRVAATSCFGPDTTKDKDAFKAALINQNPDVVLLQGDQTYFHYDLLYGFLETIYTISDITRNVPTIVQLDDHDYGQGDIWGADEGDDDSGEGFEMSPCLVNAVQRLAMGHLPDPATDATLDNGITIHYTNYIYGKTDFAVTESRKFKNRRNGDSLFGFAQEEWVREWCTNQDHLKVVLMQTPIAILATHNTNSSGMVQERPAHWKSPTTPGRDRFMDIVNGCTNLFISGDQHLGISVTYEDYDISECASPAVVNDVYWRLNLNEEGQTYINNYDMKYTLHKVWNVGPKVIEKFGAARFTRSLSVTEGTKKNRADGFLVVDLDGKSAKCEMHSYRVEPKKMWEVIVPAAHSEL